MAKKKEVRVLRGTYGNAWINGELYGNVKKFEAKITLEYEEVDIAGELGKRRRYMGYDIEGTMIFNKIDSRIHHLYNNGITTGILPDLDVISRVDDPDSAGAERVELIDVTLDELMLSQYELKNLIEEEIPFKAAAYRYLDLIA